MEGQIDKGP